MRAGALAVAWRAHGETDPEGGNIVRRIVLASMSAACIATAGAACSTSPTVHADRSKPASGIGQVIAPATTGKPAAAADLGKSITRGSLSITVAGPVTAEKDGDTGPGLLVTFHVTMTNTGSAGDVKGPDSFGVRCDANRTGDEGGEWSTSTASRGKRVPAGQTVAGTAVVSWLAWNSTVQCTGATTIEAHYVGVGFLSWTIPADQVAKVNAVGASVSATPGS